MDDESILSVIFWFPTASFVFWTQKVLKPLVAPNHQMEPSMQILHFGLGAEPQHLEALGNLARSRPMLRFILFS